MENNRIITDEQLNAFASQVASRVAINTKDVLTSDEAAVYLGVSKSFLYKLTMRKEIPHYKPNGKLCFFERLELNRWAEQVRSDVPLLQSYRIRLWHTPRRKEASDDINRLLPL